MKVARTKAKPRRIPTHPGGILRREVLPNLKLLPPEFAGKIKVSRQLVNRVLNERAAITPNLAVRIGAFIDNGPRIWLAMQQAHDLAIAERDLAGDLPAPFRPNGRL
jgi:antitoxin HigA-1